MDRDIKDMKNGELHTIDPDNDDSQYDNMPVATWYEGQSMSSPKSPIRGGRD